MNESAESVGRDGVRMTEVDYDPFASCPLERAFPTTEAQREVWLAAQLGTEASLAYNESASIDLQGQLHRTALLMALQDLVDRHEALRATVSGSGLELCIAEHLSLDVRIEDLRALGEAAQGEAVSRWLAAEVERPFDLKDGPLIRASLLQLNDESHRLVITAHHLVCDGWSFGVMVEDLAALYSARCAGTPASLAQADRFEAYSQRESSPETQAELAANEAFWLQRFEGADLPVLDLPSDRPRPGRRSFASRRRDTRLGADLVADLKRLGGQSGASLFGVLLSGFAALLARLTGQNDIVVGVPAAGQSATGMESLVGHCVNLLPVRTRIDAAGRVIDLLRSTQASLLDAFDHQQYTFGSLLKKLRFERDTSRLPLVSVMFNVDQSVDDESLDFGGLRVRTTTNPRHFENFELFVNITPESGTLGIECQYNTDLFDDATIGHWLECFEFLLRGLVRHPQASLGDVDLLPPAQQQALARWNATAVEHDRTACVHDLVMRQATLTPDRPAMRDGVAALSYAELSTRVNQFAQALRARGIGRGALVGLCVERGVSMLISQLAILRAGAAYVPLDPAFPADRLAFMASDASLALLVTQSALAASLPWPRERSLWLDDEADAIAGQSGKAPAVDPVLDARPEDPAYVIYTSGSTGRPKGVVVPHRAVVNFLVSMAREPGLQAGDRLVAVTTLSFDIAVLELLLPLTVGAEVVIASREQAGDAIALRRLIESTNATVVQATPSTWRMLVDARWEGGPRFKALVGGEPLPVDLARQLLARVGELWNMYGPTETTVWSTCCRVLTPELGIRIGRPIANTQIHVVDERGHACPIGVSGELLIGGEGLTLGYLGRPELTAKSFVSSGLAGGAPVYRSGDRARWRNDGQLEHLGRLDHQVKVRGYRIELGEIESQLASHASVAHCVVIVREDQPGDQRLVAYVVPQAGPQGAPEPDDLKRHLRGMLPEYMLPQHFVSLAAIPLLPNGKIDRKALPSPTALAVASNATVREAPRSDTERRVCAAMAALLGLPELARGDGFFALGGHSLLAAQLGMRLGRELDLHVPLRAVFDHPTVSALAAWIDSQQAGGGARQPVVPRRDDQTSAPLSLMQQRLWFLEQMQPGTPVYNTPSGHRLFGRIDESAFTRAFGEMVRRQSVLRTVFSVDTEGEPVALVLPDVPVSLFPAEDLRHLEAQEREAFLERELTRLALQPFDLRTGPLFRTRLFRIAEEEHVLFFMMHHAVWDGWSFDLFYNEISALYAAYAAGQEPRIAALPVSYGDFATWQRQWMSGQELATQVAHWKNLLAGGLDPLELPADLPRPPIQSGRAGTLWINLPRTVADGVRDLGQRFGATPFMVLLALFSAMLQRMTGRDDLVIGTPVRGRNLPELESVMGFFVNALPLRLRVSPEATLQQLIESTRDTVLDAFKYPDVPIEHLVHELKLPRDASRFPIYQVSFSYQDGRSRPTQWGNLRHQPNFVRLETIAEDLNVGFLEREDGLRGGITYNADIFSEASMQLVRARFEELVRTAIVDPRQSVMAATAPADSERQLLTAWNATRSEYPEQTCVDELLESQSLRTPEAVAVSQPGHGRLSYRELHARANQLAHLLRSRGIGRGALVGLCVERSIEMVVAQLAVLKSGAAYVPLDPAFPAERLAYMAEDANIALLVTESSLLGSLDWPRDCTFLLDVDGGKIDAMPDSPLPAVAALEARPQDPAYVIYTSGSTGRPKGVMVQHRAVVNFLLSMAREPGLNSDDTLVAVTTLSFDIAVLELLLPLSVGAHVVLARREQALDGRQLRELIESSSASAMQATPSTWRMLVDAGWSGGDGFKALIGGESLPQDLASQLLSRTGSLWNMYGPTETTVWSTCWKVENPEQGVSIGRPIANTEVAILDERQQPCPIGVPGEICIGGAGVTLGYLQRPELTAERFVANAGFTDGRMYRTGDRGRWRADGLLEHMGRLDFQVKLRGHRIELGEIEANLTSHPQVARAVVIVREDQPGDARLVAYVVAKDVEHEPLALREHLRARLPDYMLPQHFVQIAAVPLLPNGKIDRRALPAPDQKASARSTDRDRAPRTEVELALAAIWKRLLGVEHVGLTDNFFDLGGHSLLAMRVVHEVKDRFGVALSLRRLIFETLGQVAATLEPATNEAAPKPVPTRSSWFDRWFGKQQR